MIKSLVCILALLIAPVTQAEIKLTPEQKIIYEQLKFEAEGKYEDEALKSLAIADSKWSDSPFYHEHDIIDRLRDKLKILENDGAYVPNQIQSGQFLPQDDAVDSQTQVSEEGFLEAEIHRYVTGEIKGYDDGQLGIEIRRKLDTSQSPAKIMIGIRIFATEHFKRPVASTAIEVNSFMEPEEARLKLDQAIQTVAQRTGRKLSTRLSPSATNMIMNVVMSAGTVAMVTSMVYVVRKVLRKKSIKFLGIGTLAAWGLTMASYFVVEEYGDLQYLGEQDHELDEQK
jgi:hypothetical protein